MAGLSLMALGPFQFEAHGFGFQQRQKEQSTRWASVPVAGGMDVTQWTGGEGATQTIRGAVRSGASDWGIAGESPPSQR